VEKTVEVIFVAKCVKSRGMERSGPDGGVGREPVHTGYGAEGLRIWGLEYANHPFPIRHEVTADRLHTIHPETLGFGGHPRDIIRGQRLGKLALEDNVIHELRIPQRQPQ